MRVELFLPGQFHDLLLYKCIIELVIFKNVLLSFYFFKTILHHLSPLFCKFAIALDSVLNYWGGGSELMLL